MLIFLRAAGIFALVFLSSVQADELRVSTWGGVYGENYTAQVLQPFASAQGIQIEQLVDSVNSADVLELSLHEAISGCESGDLMMLPPDSLGVLGRIPSYIPNAIQPCAVGQWSWATVAGFAEGAINTSGREPRLISDFFNSTDFPGKRVLRRSPRVIVEWALAASGVPANKIYLALTEVDEAWPVIERQMRKIENDVIWVDSDEEALGYLQDGSASFAMFSTSSAVREAILSSTTPEILWDAAVVELSMMAVPSTAGNPDRAMELLRFLSEPENTLNFAASLGVSPVKYETSRLLNSEYRKYLPAEPANYENAIWGDSVWWQSAAGSKIVDLFASWVERVTALQSLVMMDRADIASASGGIFQSARRDELMIDVSY